MKIRHLGLVSYVDVFHEMKQFTLQRQDDTEDEIWLLEHPPVYTQGQAGKPEHILNPEKIPIFQSDRGGQVTYHGPGQLVAYVLMDIKRRNMGIRTLVCTLEKVIIDMLAQFDIEASIICGAPGVYVQGKKIASIGLRVKNGYTYHGIAINVAMDLKPFLGINPCGFDKLEMTQMKDYLEVITMDAVNEKLVQSFLNHFKN